MADPRPHRDVHELELPRSIPELWRYLYHRYGIELTREEVEAAAAVYFSRRSA